MKKEITDILLELSVIGDDSESRQKDTLDLVEGLIKIIRANQDTSRSLLEAITIMGKTIDHLTDTIKDLKVRVDCLEEEHGMR